MSTHDTTKYSVNSRIAALQNAVAELQKENKEIRVHLFGQLQNLVKDATSTIQASLRIPQDGRDGIDGQSIKGDQGERGPAGDITVYGDAELHAAVIALRRKLLEQRAAFLAVINQRIAENSTSNKVQQHFAKLLESVKQDIERLQ
jgi:hypothetical protein